MWFGVGAGIKTKLYLTILKRWGKNHNDPYPILPRGCVIELRRSGNLQVSITMSKCVNGRLKPSATVC